LPDIHTQVRIIAREKTIAGMIQSLFSLAELGSKHSKSLQLIGMDMDIIEKARQAGTEMIPIHARIQNLNGEGREEYELRNKAYTHLKAAVDEVRKVGKFALRNNKRRLPGYTSDFLRTKKQKQMRKKDKV
jgi:hypothetical protein